MNKHLTNKIKEMRTKKGISMYQISKDAGKVNQSHYSRIELGYMEPTVSTALKLAKSLGCTVEDLFQLSN